MLSLGEPQRVHYSALADYHSYDLAWLGPITFPLAVALIAQLSVYLSLLRGRFSRVGKAPDPSPVIQGAVLMILAAETIFGVLCIVQCIINWSHRAFVGGADWCDAQAHYSSYYIYAGMGLCTFGIVVGCYVRVHGSANLGIVLGAGLTVHAVALALASLPRMGAGAYLFAVDFCLVDLESPLFATLTVGIYLACVAIIFGALCYEWRSRVAASSTASPPMVLYVLAIWFLIAWYSVIHVSLLWWLYGGTVYDSAHKGAYAWMGMLTHTNQVTALPLQACTHASYSRNDRPCIDLVAIPCVPQLVVPLCFGYFWRYQLLGTLATRGRVESLKAAILPVV